MKPTFVNLTQHDVNIHTPSGVVTVKPSGVVARRREHTEYLGQVGQVSVFKKTYWEVMDLPDRQEGVLYIVSAMVLDCVDDRGDLLAPGTAIRDSSGKVIGCDGLVAGHNWWL